MRLKTSDFRLERADLKPDWVYYMRLEANFRPKRVDFRPKRAYFRDGETEKHRNKIALCGIIGQRPLPKNGT